MQKRNIILIAIILGLIAITTFVALYFYNPASTAPKADTTTGNNFIANFLPFLKSKDTSPTTTPPVDVSGYVPPANTTAELPKENLIKVSSMPVAGFGVFMKERFVDVPVVIPPPATPAGAITTPLPPPPQGGEVKSTTKTKKAKVAKPTAPLTEFVPAIRYVEKATGNIYETFADKLDERKFTTTVVPRVHEAFFGNNGQSVVMRYLKETSENPMGIIETFVGALPKEVLGADTISSTAIAGSFLPENITDLSVSADTSKIFYLFNYGNNSVGITSDPVGSKKVQVFNSPFTEWLSWYPNSKMVTLTTKASASVPGFMYALDPNMKSYNKLLGEINGLTTLTSPSGSLILYTGNDLSLRLYHADNSTSSTLGVKTLPEKCAWNKTSTSIYCAVPKYVTGNNYPDTWYQGEVSFSDEIWKIDVATESASQLIDPVSTRAGEDVDGIKLAVDDSEAYLFFVNKKDNYLWELSLK